MKVKTEIYNTAEARINTVDLKSLDVLGYDQDNRYPQRLIDITNNSGTAITSLRIFRKYVFGKGFADPDFKKAIINNDRMTVDKLARKCAWSLGRFNGIAIHVNYTGLLDTINVNLIPWEYNRLTIGESDHSGMIAVFDDWGLSKPDAKQPTQESIDYLHKFDPSKVLEQVAAIEVETKGKTDEEIDNEKWSNYKGQVYFWTPNGSNEYTLATYDPVLEDMQTEANTKSFKKSTSGSNFLASHILVTGKSEDKDASEEFDENLKGFQGGKNAAKLMVVEKENEEDTIELVEVPIQKYDGLYEFTEGSSKASIRENFMIPPVLYVVQANGGIGDSKVITDAKLFYNEITEDERKIISEIFEDIFSIFHVEINPLKDWSLAPLVVSVPIPKEFLADFTKDERRKSLGYEPSKEEGGNEVTLAQTLGVGGTQSLTEVMVNPELSDGQKKGALIVLFGLSEDDANKLLGKETKEPTLPA